MAGGESRAKLVGEKPKSDGTVEYEERVLPEWDPEKADFEPVTSIENDIDACVWNEAPDNFNLAKLLNDPLRAMVKVSGSGQVEGTFFKWGSKDKRKNQYMNPGNYWDRFKLKYAGRDGEFDYHGATQAGEYDGAFFECRSRTPDDNGDYQIYLYDFEKYCTGNEINLRAFVQGKKIDLTPLDISKIIYLGGYKEARNYCVGGAEDPQLSLPPDLGTVKTVIALVRDTKKKGSENYNIFGSPERAEAVAKALEKFIGPELEAERTNKIYKVLQILGLILSGVGLLAAPFLYNPETRRAFVRWISEKVLRRPLKVDFIVDMKAEFQAGRLNRAVGRFRDYEDLRGFFDKIGRRVRTYADRGGNGKTYFMQDGLAYEIFSGHFIGEGLDPANTEMFSLNLSAMEGHSDSKYVGQLTARFNDFVKKVDEAVAKGKKVVVSIDEIHRLVGMGATSGHESGGLENTIKDVISKWEKNNNIYLLAATTSEEYEKYFAHNETLARRFIEHPLRPLASGSRFMILRNEVARYAERRGAGAIQVDGDATVRAIELSHYESIPGSGTLDPAVQLQSDAEAEAFRRKKKGVGDGRVTPQLVEEVFVQKYSRYGVKLEDVRKWSHPTVQSEVGDFFRIMAVFERDAAFQSMSPADKADFMDRVVHNWEEKQSQAGFSEGPISEEVIIEEGRKINPNFYNEAQASAVAPSCTPESVEAGRVLEERLGKNWEVRVAEYYARQNGGASPGAPEVEYYREWYLNQFVKEVAEAQGNPADFFSRFDEAYEVSKKVQESIAFAEEANLARTTSFRPDAAARYEDDAKVREYYEKHPDKDPTRNRNVAANSDVRGGNGADQKEPVRVNVPSDMGDKRLNGDIVSQAMLAVYDGEAGRPVIEELGLTRVESLDDVERAVQKALGEKKWKELQARIAKLKATHQLTPIAEAGLYCEAVYTDKVEKNGGRFDIDLAIKRMIRFEEVYYEGSSNDRSPRRDRTEIKEEKRKIAEEILKRRTNGNVIHR
jgi:hypothetical protein